VGYPAKDLDVIQRYTTPLPEWVELILESGK